MIIVGNQEEIDLYENTAIVFFKDMFDISISNILITDLSNLSDFSSCGFPRDYQEFENLEDLYDAWDAWIVPRICNRFNIETFKTNISLIDLFKMIENSAHKYLH